MDSASTFVLREILDTVHKENQIRVCLCGLADFHVNLFQRAGMAAMLEGNMFDTMAAAVADVEARMGGLLRARRADESVLAMVMTEEGMMSGRFGFGKED
jgi:hypothetical protein